MGTKGFSYLHTVVKEFIVNAWELRKLKLYGKDTCPGPQSDSSWWDRGQDGEFRNGKRGELSHSSDACTSIHNSVDLHANVCGSAQCCGCVVNGYDSLSAIET